MSINVTRYYNCLYERNKEFVWMWCYDITYNYIQIDVNVWLIIL